MVQAAEKNLNQTRLVSIERDGRVNKFTFTRNGEIHVIETLGIWGDDVKKWKKDLL